MGIDKAEEPQVNRLQPYLRGKMITIPEIRKIHTQSDKGSTVVIKETKPERNLLTTRCL